MDCVVIPKSLVSSLVFFAEGSQKVHLIPCLEALKLVLSAVHHIWNEFFPLCYGRAEKVGGSFWHQWTFYDKRLFPSEQLFLFFPHVSTVFLMTADVCVAVAWQPGGLSSVHWVSTNINWKVSSLLKGTKGKCIVSCTDHDIAVQEHCYTMGQWDCEEPAAPLGFVVTFSPLPFLGIKL